MPVRRAVTEPGAGGHRHRVDANHHRARHIAQLARAVRPGVGSHIHGELAADEGHKLRNVEPVGVPRSLAVESGGPRIGEGGAVGTAQLRVRCTRAWSVHARDEDGGTAAIGTAVAEGVERSDGEADGPAHKVARAARRLDEAARGVARPEQLRVGR